MILLILLLCVPADKISAQQETLRVRCCRSWLFGPTVQLLASSGCACSRDSVTRGMLCCEPVLHCLSASILVATFYRPKAEPGSKVWKRPWGPCNISFAFRSWLVVEAPGRSKTAASCSSCSPSMPSALSCGYLRHALCDMSSQVVQLTVKFSEVILVRATTHSLTLPPIPGNELLVDCCEYGEWYCTVARVCCQT